MDSDIEIRSRVVEVLKRFNDLVSARDFQVLAEFAPRDQVLLIGSEAGEIASGRGEIESFFKRVFAKEQTYSWDWDRIDVSHADNLAWFFADGWVVCSTATEVRRMPYRVTGVLERYGDRWLWRQYHGSEPAASQ